MGGRPGRELDAAVTAPGVDGTEAEGFIVALGGAGNLQSVDASTTRLRLVVGDSAAVDQAALRRLGSRGVVDLGAGSLQVVLGPIADQVAGRIRAELKRQGQRPASDIVKVKVTGAAGTPATASAGGARVLLRVQQVGDLDSGALERLGVRAVARLKDGAVQLLLGPAAVPVYRALRVALQV